MNTGCGDFELRFKPDRPDQVQKAKETITDMLKRGYAIFVRQGKDYKRVRKFDVDRNVYVIGSTPPKGVPGEKSGQPRLGAQRGADHGRI